MLSAAILHSHPPGLIFPTTPKMFYGEKFIEKFIDKLEITSHRVMIQLFILYMYVADAALKNDKLLLLNVKCTV